MHNPESLRREAFAHMVRSCTALGDFMAERGPSTTLDMDELLLRAAMDVIGAPLTAQLPYTLLARQLQRRVSKGYLQCFFAPPCGLRRTCLEEYNACRDNLDVKSLKGIASDSCQHEYSSQHFITYSCASPGKQYVHQQHHACYNCKSCFVLDLHYTSFLGCIIHILCDSLYNSQCD